MMRLTILIAATLVPTSASAQETVSFAGLEWEASGEVEVAAHMGREALRMRTGNVELDTRFDNGTISFDVVTTGHRSFTGIAFRVRNDGADYEYFYIRPHQTNRFDATQYTPAFNGITAWQLYPEYNVSHDLPVDRWMPVRIELEGAHMEVFLDGESVLEVDRLAHGAVGGSIVLTAFTPEDQTGLEPPTDTMTAAFSNFELERAPAATMEVGAEMVDDPRIISQWAISPAMTSDENPMSELPETGASGWNVGSTDGAGRLNIAKYRAKPEGAAFGAVLVRAVIESERTQMKKLNFGFSDLGSLFLNGRILLSQDNRYLSRSDRYLGVMNLENDAIYLPLRQGRNELSFVVAEGFGGWGLTARLGDLEGLRVLAELP